MKLNEFVKKIETEYNREFKHSYIMVEHEKTFYNSIYIKLYLVNSKDECIHNILNNDMLSVKFIIDMNGSELPNLLPNDELPENLRLKVLEKSYLIKPENSYLCYSRTKLNFRMVKGKDEKIVKSLTKYFKALKESLLNDLENNLIHKDFTELLKLKIESDEV